MDSGLYGKLVGHKIFQDLKDNESETPNGKLRNLLELKDDVLYVWNSVENCLFTLNLKHLEENGDETPYQKLQLISPPAFSVEQVISSVCGSRLCLWGSRGVTVVELPSRWGRGGLFDSGKQIVLCKSFALDERFLYCQGEIRKVNWHPSSLSHLLILVSDNSLRLYNIGLKTGPKLVKIFPIGPKPHSGLSGMTFLDSLGDTAVDFAAVPGTDTLMILRGTGDVCMMEFELVGKSPLQWKLSDPLAMYPPADDNYGTESCSIISLAGGADCPPLVIVATSSGSLYHCLLLPNAPDKHETNTHALYVVESVEITTTNSKDNAMNSYPVHLYACSHNSYACMHSGGVHTVTVSVLGNLLDYALADEVDADSVLSSVLRSTSWCRHVVSAGAPPRGLVVTAPPLPALILLGRGALYRTLEPYNLEETLYKELQFKNPALEQDDINKLITERQKLSFITYIIQEILRRDVSQPILHGNNFQTPNECLELVTEATMKLRGEYISRMMRASTALRTKTSALLATNEQRSDAIRSLQEEVNEVQKQSQTLREKCILAEKHQEDLKYRCSAVIRYVRGASASSPVERAMLKELEEFRGRAEAMREEIALLKGHARHNDQQMKKWKEEYKKKDIALGKSHSETIASILQQHTSQISTLIEETKLLKDQLSIV